MTSMNLTCRLLLAAAALLLLGMNSSAVVFDWTQPYATWTAGQTSNTYNFDPANPGNDITISVVYTGAAQTAGYPINTAAGSSVVGSNDATRLQIRTTGMGGTNPVTNNVTITITFNYAAGVTNAGFTLIDVDKQTGSWIDRFSSINATPVTGSPNSVALTATSANTGVATVTGSGTLGMTVQGVGVNVTDHSGDITFATGATPIKSLTLNWNNPGPDLLGQVIALSNISFTPVVPEVGSGSGALLLCSGLLAFRRQRKGRLAA